MKGNSFNPRKMSAATSKRLLVVTVILLHATELYFAQGKLSVLSQEKVARSIHTRVKIPHPLPPGMWYLVWYMSTLGLTNRPLRSINDDRPKAEIVLPEIFPRRANSSYKHERIEGKSISDENFVDSSDLISFSRYNTELEINRFLDHISTNHRDIATVFSIGRSVEGREIRAVKLSSGGFGLKPAILLDGGIHAREWISPAAVLFVLNEMVTKRQKYSGLLDKVDWYIVPLLNPDGYIYSMSRDRMWRKNRAKTWRHQNTVCSGVDLNRNFGVDHAQFASENYDPCSAIYRGPGPFSEPESTALRDFIMANRMQIKVYLSFHSFGNYILYPWGYRNTRPPDWQSLERLATAASKAIGRNSGAVYRVGSSSAMLGTAAGGSTDWVKGHAGIQYAYTMELPGGGKYGFDLPDADILKVSSDIFQAVKVFATFIAEESAQNAEASKRSTNLISPRTRLRFSRKPYV